MDRIKIIEQMRKDRYTYKEIAKFLGISRARIYQLLEREKSKKLPKLEKDSKNAGFLSTIKG